MLITDNGKPLSKSEWDGISVYVLDVDDASYHGSTQLHDRIKEKICADANANPDLAALKKGWAAQKIVREDGLVEQKNLGVVFPLIVNFYRQQGADGLKDYLAKVYDVDYSVIPPQPGFIEAVSSLRDAGKKVVVYTNGPYGEFNGRLMHVNKVFRAIGFPDDAFPEQDVVDLIKTDRNPDLLGRFGADLARAADVFRKPTKAGFLNACQIWGVEPHGGTFAHVAYLDDGSKNFSEISGLGVNGILIGMRPGALGEEPGHEHARVKVWQDERDDRGRYFSTVGPVLECAAGLKPFPAMARRSKRAPEAARAEIR